MYLHYKYILNIAYIHLQITARCYSGIRMAPSRYKFTSFILQLLVISKSGSAKQIWHKK